MANTLHRNNPVSLIPRQHFTNTSEDLPITLLFHGTGCHQDKYSIDQKAELPTEKVRPDILNWLGDYLDPQHSHIINGPGGKPHRGHEHHPSPVLGNIPMQFLGKRNILNDIPTPFLKEGVDTPNITYYPTFKGLHLNKSKVNSLYQRIFADNSICAVMEASNVIFTHCLLPSFRGKEGMEVVMIGWSRGAMHAIWTANVLAELYNKINIKLFLFDPVGGFSHHNRSEIKIIPANVKETYILWSMDEQRADFKPLELRYASLTTQVHNIYLPGAHSLLTKRGLPENYYYSLSCLVKKLLLRFCSRSKVQFKKCATTNTVVQQSQFTLDEILDNYCNLKKAEPLIIQNLPSKKLYYIGINHRIKSGRSLFFVNTHHERLFLKKHPILGQILQRIIKGPVRAKELKREALEMLDTLNAQQTISRPNYHFLKETLEKSLPKTTPQPQRPLSLIIGKEEKKPLRSPIKIIKNFLTRR